MEATTLLIHKYNLILKIFRIGRRTNRNERDRKTKEAKDRDTKDKDRKVQQATRDKAKKVASRSYR